MKCIILARVSTEEQREAGNSLPAQQERLRRYIERTPRLELDKEFIFDESAFKEHRTEFDKVIAYVSGHKDVVAFCCDKVDRLTRDFLVGLPQLERLRRDGKIELHFPSDNLVLHRGSPATDLFHFNIAVSLAQYYSNAISDNTKRAFEQKRRAGEWTGPARIGYKGVPLDAERRTRRDLVPDPERAHLVQRIFELYATGAHSITSVWKEVTRLGLRGLKGQELSRSNIEQILKDTFYYGMAYSGKYNERYPHRYKCLITKDLFDRCQAVLGSRHKRPSQVEARPFILRGVMTCKNCGCLMTPELKVKRSGLKFIYYSCTNGKGVCKREYVAENVLLAPVCAVFKSFATIPKDVQDRLVAELKDMNESDATFRQKELSRIQSEYNRVQKRIGVLIDMRLDESITKGEYDQKLQELKDEQYRLTIELKEYTKADRQHHIHVNTVLNLSRYMGQIFESSEVAEKRQFLQFLLQNPTVSGKTLEFALRKPFDTVLALAHHPFGLPKLDEFRTADWGRTEAEFGLLGATASKIMSEKSCQVAH